MDQGKLKAHRVRTWACFLAVLALLVLAAVAPLLAAFEAFRPAIDPQSTWFQRSGSITAVVALLGGVVIPYAYSKLHKPGTWGEDEGLAVLEEFKHRFQLAEWFALCITIVGTVIGGYGDLIWKAVVQS